MSAHNGKRGLRYRNKHSNHITIISLLVEVNEPFVALDFQAQHNRFHCIIHIHWNTHTFSIIDIRWASHQNVVQWFRWNRKRGHVRVNIIITIITPSTDLTVKSQTTDWIGQTIYDQNNSFVVDFFSSKKRRERKR